MWYHSKQVGERIFVMAPGNINNTFFIGTATIDLTQSDMGIFQQWFISNIVHITTLTPVANALTVWFCSNQTIPGGIAASSVVYSSLMVDTVI